MAGRWALGAALAVLLALLLLVACATQEGGEAPASQPAPVGPLSGDQLLQDRCGRCHGLDRVTGAKKTLEEWDATVRRMSSRGAELDETEFAVLVEYLAATFR